MVADLIYSIAIFFYNILAKLLPTSIFGYTTEDLSGQLDFINDYLINPIKYFNYYIPIDTFFTIIVLILGVEGLVYLYKQTKAAANLARGSGA